jgi:FixJ family two-component response regulator
MLPAAKPMVFVVDDDLSVRKSLTRLLAAAKYTVEAFASAREFLAREPYAGPSCLVLDVQMPGLTGLDLQEALAAVGRRMSIVFVSGHVNVPMSVKAMKGEAVDLLTKPVDDRDLLKAIQRAVAKHTKDLGREAGVAKVRERVKLGTRSSRKWMSGPTPVSSRWPGKCRVSGSPRPAASRSARRDGSRPLRCVQRPRSGAVR